MESFTPNTPSRRPLDMHLPKEPQFSYHHVFPLSSSHMFSSETFTRHDWVIEDCQQDWKQSNRYGVPQAPSSSIHPYTRRPSQCYLISEAQHFKQLIDKPPHLYCSTPYEASDLEQTLANVNHREPLSIHPQPIIHTSNGTVNRSEGAPYSGWQPRATGQALHRSPAANLRLIPTEHDTITAHEKKQYYLECLEKYVPYLHRQVELVGLGPAKLEQVSGHHGLSIQSVRTLVVLMQDQCWDLAEKIAKEEQRASALRDAVGRQGTIRGYPQGFMEHCT